MLAELNNLGKLVEKVRSEIDYKSKKQPLVSVCEKGKVMGQLYCPHDVAVDNKTGNIYIAELEDNCVKVFESTGRYLFKFGKMKMKERWTDHKAFYLWRYNSHFTR